MCTKNRSQLHYVAMLSIMLLLHFAFDANAGGTVDLLRERELKDAPTLMVVGTGHFANPGQDIVNDSVDNVLSKRRQQEVEQLVAQLATFRPTQLAVEWPAKEQGALDQRYKDYLEHRYVLGPSEVDQLGIRLAGRFHLDKVYAADWNDAPTGPEKDYDWPAFLESKQQQATLEAITAPTRTLGFIPLGDQPLVDWISALNRSQVLSASHRNYFDVAVIGDDTMQPGANWVGHWYGRNLRIFRNLTLVSRKPTDRLLVIFGQGHAYLLQQFAVESGAFKVQAVSTVLSPSAHKSH